MPTYSYIATDAEGRRLTGEIEATDAGGARSQLTARGLTIEGSIQEAITVTMARLSSEESTELGIHLGTLIKTGLPLASGLRAAGEELALTHRHRRLARSMCEMADKLESGDTLESVMQQTTYRFPAHLRGIVAAGVRSGRLDETMMWFVDMAGSSRRRRLQILAVSVYPAVLLLMALGIFFFMAAAIVPAFAEIFQDFGADLPAPTKMVMYLGAVGPTLILVLASLSSALVGVFYLVGGLGAIYRVLHVIPLYGRLWFYEGLGELSGLLSLLLRQQVPLPDSLKLVGQSLSDKALSKSCFRLADIVSDGQPLAEGLSRAYRPLGSLAPVVRWGESHDSLDVAFEYVSDMSRSNADLQADYMAPLFPPLVFMIIVIGVGFTVVALFLPLIKLVQTLS